MLIISEKKYTYNNFIPFLNGPVKIRIDKTISNKIRKYHNLFCQLLEQGVKIYGVNTGFGQLSQVSINKEQQNLLQLNLVRSHAAGVGDPLDISIVRIAMALKLLTYAKGVSGIRYEVANQIVQFLNHDIIPVVPSKGSVGASGDLAPLAHIALTFIGEGLVHFQDRILPSMLAMKETGIEPIILGPKEGLSLINGTQISTAIAIKSLIQSEILLKTADIIGALSTESSFSSRQIFKASIHKLKDHQGQRHVARNIWRYLENSEIVKSHVDCDRIQDPYSIRCIPHVHGTGRDIFSAVKNIVNKEINSVSDNPLILKNGEVHGSGHFHAEPIAQSMDCLGITMSEIGAISERRIHFFMKGISDKVPPFVAMNPGLESGFMLAHVTAAALVSENKTLSHPASVDSIPTSAGQEDFVSMAPWSGRKALIILQNVTYIIAIELLVAHSTWKRFHKNLGFGLGTEPVNRYLNRKINIENHDHVVSANIEKVADLISNNKIINITRKHVLVE